MRSTLSQLGNHGMRYSLIIDQGTHASRAMLFDRHGRLHGQHTQAIEVNHIDAQRVEQSPGAILASIHQCIDALDPALLAQTDNAALCTQRSTVVAWHRDSGEALYPAISWQDRRSFALLKNFEAQRQRIQQITGLPLSAHYGAGKILWLLQHVDAVREAHRQDALCVGPLASFLLFHLCRERPFMVDHSNAHRMQLLDLQQGDWSQPLLQMFGIPRSLLPECRPLHHDYGTLRNHPIRLRLLCGDQTAALHGYGAPQANAAYVNIGSGAFVLCPMDHRVEDEQLLCSIADSRDGRLNYLLEGTVNGAGAALDWMQQREPVADLFEQLPGWLDTDDASSPLFLNAVGGVGSPWWRADLESRFVHAENSTIETRYRAVIDSIVFLITHNLQAMSAHLDIRQLYVSGGLSRLNGLCQRLCDLNRLQVERLHETEATALGAHRLLNDSVPETSKPETDRQFTPAPCEKLERAYKDFTGLFRTD